MAIFICSLVFLIAEAVKCENVGNFGNKTTALIPIDTPMPNTTTISADIETPDRTKVLRILTSIMYSGAVAMGPTVTISQQMALNWLHRQSNWLPGYRLEFELIDDQSDDAVAISGLLDKIRRNEEIDARFPLVGLLEYAGFSQVLSAYLMKSYNMIGIDAYPMPETFFKRQNFQNYFPIGERQDYYMYSVAMFVAQMGWKRVALLTDTSSFNVVFEPFHLKYLEANNVSLAYFGKTRESTTDEYELDSMFTELKQREPRIIINCNVDSLTTACYLHKYRMYGPSYVIITYSWTNFDENSPIPDFIAGWCTSKMLIDVLASSIFFGDAALAFVYGDNFKDFTGITMGGFMHELKSHVDHPEEIQSLEYWVPVFYDRAILIGILLNETENALNVKNMTISDWTTSTENYGRNPDFILDIIKDSIYKLNVTGIRGEWSYNRETMWPSGSMPIVYTQTRIINGDQSKQVPVANYKSNRLRDKTVIFWDKLEWHTADGSVPKDRLFVQTVASPLLPIYVNAILYILALINMTGIFAVFGLTCYQKWKSDTSQPISLYGVTVLVGDLLLTCSLFALPYGTGESCAANSSIMAILMLTGFSVLILAITENISSNLAFYSNFNSQNGLGTQRSHWKFFFIIPLASIPSVLLIATMVESPIKVVKIPLQMEYSSTDASLAFQYQQERCLVIEALFGSTTSTALSAVAAGFLLIYLFRSIVLVFKVRSVLKDDVRTVQIPTVAEMRRDCIFIVGILIFLLGAIFIGILLGSNNASLTILTSVLIFLIVFTNLAKLVAWMFWKPDLSPPKPPYLMGRIRRVSLVLANALRVNVRKT